MLLAIIHESGESLFYSTAWANDLLALTHFSAALVQRHLCPPVPYLSLSPADHSRSDIERELEAKDNNHTRRPL